MKTLHLVYVDMDRHKRPVYIDAHSRLWKDIDPRPWRDLRLFHPLNNDFEGEPDYPLTENVKIELHPKRIVWRQKDEI